MIPGMAGAMVSQFLLGSLVSSPIVYRSNASWPSGRQKRTWNTPKNSFSSGNATGVEDRRTL
jgi:hypothetical protein